MPLYSSLSFFRQTKKIIRQPSWLSSRHLRRLPIRSSCMPFIRWPPPPPHTSLRQANFPTASRPIAVLALQSSCASLLAAATPPPGLWRQAWGGGHPSETLLETLPPPLRGWAIGHVFWGGGGHWKVISWNLSETDAYCVTPVRDSPAGVNTYAKTLAWFRKRVPFNTKVINFLYERYLFLWHDSTKRIQSLTRNFLKFSIFSNPA